MATYRAKMKTGDWVEGTEAEMTAILTTIRKVHGDVKADIFRSLGGKVINLGDAAFYEQNQDEIDERDARVVILTKEMNRLQAQGRSEEATAKQAEIDAEIASIDTDMTTAAIYEAVDIDSDGIADEIIP